MQKKALEIDPSVVGRYAAGGAMAGGGIAALVNLVHMINQMRADRAKKMAPTETDENTIVLTLPRKQAEVEGNTKVKSITGPSVNEIALNYGQGKQPRVARRNPGAGRFGPKICMGSVKEAAGSTGWPTLSASVLAALGAGMGGATLVNKLYEVQRERRLKAELDAAKQEYMDLLMGNSVKGASTVDELFGLDLPVEKQADSTFGMLNYPMAALAVLTLLGSGATGYITKKILDEKFREAQGKSLEIPKVKRIVFRTEPEQDQSKIASADERQAAAAGLLVMMDRVSGTTRFSGHETVRPILEKQGMTKEALIKQSDDWDTLVSHLEGAPELRKALYNLYVNYTTTNPVSRAFKRTALKIPRVQRSADSRLYSMIGNIRSNGQPGAASTMRPKVAQEIAAALPLMSMSSSLFGTPNPGDLLDEKLSPQELAKLIVAAQEEVQQRKLMKDTKVPDSVQIGAADAGAADYVGKNRGKIDSVVKRLASEGQI